MFKTIIDATWLTVTVSILIALCVVTGMIATNYIPFHINNVISINR